MSAKLGMKVSDADVAAFARDGAVRIKNVVDMADVESLRAASDEVMRDPGEFAIGNVAQKSGSEFFTEVFVWKRNDVYRRFIEDSGLSDMACRVMPVEKIRLFYDYMLYKSAGSGTATPWHHDITYYPVTPESQICSIWVALDKTTLQSGGLEYIAGSHKWGKLFAPDAFDGGDSFANTGYEPIPDFDQERADHRILDWDLEPGDCLVHHVATVHSAPENTSGNPRRGIALRWLAGDVIFDPRPVSAERIKKVVSSEPNSVRAGEVIQGPDFPQFTLQ